MHTPHSPSKELNRKRPHNISKAAAYRFVVAREMDREFRINRLLNNCCYQL